MPEIFSGAAKRLRLPPPFEGVNVNFCKNPLCPNFGVPAEIEDRRGRPKKNTNERSAYFVTKSPHESALRCSVCNVHTVVKSNKAVWEEFDRHLKALKFLADRERHFPEMKLGDMKTCTDMQDYMVNWPQKALRKTVQFRAIATSCLDTGYVLACHPQIDTRFSTIDIQDQVLACGDLELRPAFREFARLWNYEDYASALALPPDVFLPTREDQEMAEHMTVDRQLPDQGAMVHIDYLAFGHFMFLRHLLCGANRIHFSLDADPGLANAVFASWVDKVKEGKIDVAVMTCDKAATIDEKNMQVAMANKLKEMAIEQYPKLHPFKAFLTFFVDHSILGRLNGPQRGLALRKREIAYPFIKKSEPGKKVRLYTDDGSRSAVEIAGVFHDTSLHQVDRFFMQIRRGIAGLERAPSYPRRASRKWYLYGFYSPEMVEKALVIYRTYFNFIAKGQDGKTPAMRIGLAKGTIRFEDVLYFN